jgi:hypothetical protein
MKATPASAQREPLAHPQRAPSYWMLSIEERRAGLLKVAPR